MLILLVEDHEDTRRAMSYLLRMSGHDVREAGSAKEALEVASGTSFECALIDLGLPDAEGTELMRQLLARGPLKAIALTGSTAPADIEACRDAGFMLHLPKPVMLDELESALAHLQVMP